MSWWFEALVIVQSVCFVLLVFVYCVLREAHKQLWFQHHELNLRFYNERRSSHVVDQSRDD